MASTVASRGTERLSNVETPKSEGGSPKITRKLRGKRAKIGGKVVLSCAANVCDDTKITWFKNGAEFTVPFVTSQEENEHRVYSTINEDEIELIIDNVQRDDAGYYLCVASNAQGEASSMAELSVKAF
ncbi:neural cell adhesion molecule 1-A-like [Styela clava]